MTEAIARLSSASRRWLLTSIRESFFIVKNIMESEFFGDLGGSEFTERTYVMRHLANDSTRLLIK